MKQRLRAGGSSYARLGFPFLIIKLGSVYGKCFISSLSNRPPAQPTVNHASVAVVHRSRTRSAAAASLAPSSAVHFLPGLTRFVRDAAAAAAAASYESGTTRLDPYYERRKVLPPFASEFLCSRRLQGSRIYLNQTFWGSFPSNVPFLPRLRTNSVRRKRKL